MSGYKITKLRLLWHFCLSDISRWYREIWKQDGNASLCCSGYECGCQGACYINEWEWSLHRLTERNNEMRDLGINTVECVVIESDWPEYETVWGMIEARCSGKPQSAEIEALRGEVAIVTANAKASHDLNVTLADTISQLRARNAALEEAAAKVLPFNVENGPDYASVYFGDGSTHSTQAMTMNPQDWLDLEAALRAILNQNGEA